MVWCIFLWLALLLRTSFGSLFRRADAAENIWPSYNVQLQRRLLYPLHPTSHQPSRQKFVAITSLSRTCKDARARPWIVGFQEKHPRVYGALYQVALYAVTLSCAAAMTRYLPYSLPSDVGDIVNGTNATNSTTERMCKWGAREADVKPVAVRRSIAPSIFTCKNTDKTQYVLPYLILCTSTFTVIQTPTILFTALKYPSNTKSRNSSQSSKRQLPIIVQSHVQIWVSGTALHSSSGDLFPVEEIC
jgi:hypothetical protein